VSKKLTISALKIAPVFSLETDATASPYTTVKTSISGSYVEMVGAPPAGEWVVEARDSQGEIAFSTTVTQPTTAESGEVGTLDIPIEKKLRPNETFEVSAIFVPEESIADGLIFANPAPQPFETAPPTVAERLARPMPVWSIAFVAAAILGALTLLTVIIVKRARRNRGGVAGASASTATPVPTSTPAPGPTPVPAPALQLGQGLPPASPAPPAPSLPPTPARQAVTTGATPEWEINGLFADETAPHEVNANKTW